MRKVDKTALAEPTNIGQEDPGARMSLGNSIRVIFPYRRNGVWMFDDNIVGLEQEPFVAGIPEMIDTLVANIENAEQGFALYFSADPFPGFTMRLDWLREESGGNWYRLGESEGWLCPSLFRYFSVTPNTLYVKAEARA